MSRHTALQELLSFDVWKARLREDCELLQKMTAFEAIGEECLKVLWKAGTEPSVQGICDGGR